MGRIKHTLTEKEIEAQERVVASYARVSTDKDEQEMSFDSQMLYFKDEVEKAGLTFYKAYGDKGMSGTKLNNREELNKMLYDAGIDIREIVDKETRKKVYYYICSTWRRPKFGQIWIKSTSRFARNTFSFELIQRLRENHVYIRFLLNGIYTKDPSSDMQLKLLQTFDENESRTKGDATRWGFQRGAERGRIYCGGKLFGYDYNPADNTLRKNKDAEIVRKVYDLYLSGKGIRVIRNTLFEEGIKAPNGGEKWGYTSLKNMLKNEKYAGLNNACKFDSGRVLENKHYSKPKEHYIVEKTDKIDAIISEQEFYKVRELMAEKCDNLNNPTRGKRKSYSKYAGMLYCACCGKMYIRNSDYRRKKDPSSKYFFYCCSTKRKEGASVCKNINITESQVDETVKDISRNVFKYFEEEKQKMLENIYITSLKQHYFSEYMDDEDNPYSKAAISSETFQHMSELEAQLTEATLAAIKETDPNLRAAYEKAKESINEELTALQKDIKDAEDIAGAIKKTIYIYDEIIKIKSSDFKKTYTTDDLEDIIPSYYVYEDKDGKPVCRPIFGVFLRFKELYGEEEWNNALLHFTLDNSNISIDVISKHMDRFREFASKYFQD